MNKALEYCFILNFLLIVWLLGGCKNKSEYIEVRGKEYAGAGTCAKCHQKICQDSQNNSHSKATMPATEENVLGNFDGKENTFVYSQSLKLKMEEHRDSLYQVVYLNDQPVERHKFDVVFGVKNAQTALFWKEGKPYELPISYYSSVKNWGTSPGYNSQRPFFNRLIKKDCFSCHSSNINAPQPKGSKKGEQLGSVELSGMLDKASIIYGIDCERCHGPATQHIQHHLAFPAEKMAKFMVSNKVLNNQQRLDRCAICHTGNQDERLQSRFDFKPGDSLSNFFLHKPRVNSSQDFDVHGNQNELLQQSQCFIKSKTLNCITCHNPHTNAAEGVAAYSQKCMSCHRLNSANFCTNIAVSQPLLKNNCIDCHMPSLASGAISFKQSNRSTQDSYQLRTHKIGVYNVSVVQKKKLEELKMFMKQAVTKRI